MAQVNLQTTIYEGSPILSITFTSQVTGESEIITFTLGQNQTLPFTFDPTNYGLNPNDVYGTFTIEFYNKCVHSVTVVGTVYECEEYEIINGDTGYVGLSVEDFIGLPSGYEFNSSNPATFQSGITTYGVTADYTVPAGYINTNDVIPCTGNTTFNTILEPLECPTLSPAVFAPEGISGTTVDFVSGSTLPAPFTGYTLGNGYTISPATYTGNIGDSPTYTITFDTPNGYYTIDGDGNPITDGTIDCTQTARTIGVFTCEMANISINEGVVDDDIQFTFNTAYGNDYVTLVGPSTYQQGNEVPYEFTVEIPGNYVNEDGTDAAITCIVTETSLSPFNCPTITIPEGTLDATIITGDITLNPGNIGTVNSIEPTTYQLGEYTYDVAITVANGFEGAGTTETCPATLRTCYVPVDGVPAFTATVID